ncbi:MAG: hypothetical protein ABSB00_02015 [Minisyncoccia bacterium]|jgi:flagellar basal body-associated protein FliL
MKSKNLVLIIVIVLIAAAGVYWYFFTGTGNQPTLLIGGTENQAQAQFETLVSELTPISFDTSIFSDSRFNALVDISTPITPEPISRPDPFAVIASVD